MYNKFRGLYVKFVGFIEFEIILQWTNPWTGSKVWWTGGALGRVARLVLRGSEARQ
jgi:hypothetical protein